MNRPVEGSRQKDAELWQQVLEDNQTAFETVVFKYQNLVASIAYSLTGQFNLSEEVAQETFWQAWRQRQQLREPSRLAAWLCAIARNLALQTAKTERRLVPLDGIAECAATSADPQSVVVSTEENDLVWSALRQLPERYRDALILYYREGHSMADVALALDTSVDAAKQRVSRGRDMLRERLARQIEEVLVRTRPNSSLTRRIMVGVAALSTSLNAASTATAAGLAGSAVKSAAGAAGMGMAKSLVAGGVSAGFLGGLLGVAGGLGGAWLGTWLPARWAPSLAERRILEQSGKRQFMGSLLYSLVVMLLTPLVFLQGGLLWYFAALGLSTCLFIGVVTRAALVTRRQVTALRIDQAKIRETDRDSGLWNPAQNTGRFRGRRYTSPVQILGWPLVDIQFQDRDPWAVTPSHGRSACGWIAIGDQATGILLAIGGVARGLIAIGGVACGGLALGGLAVGGIALGGGAIACLAVGGLAIGYDAAGGAAIGWHSAAGGGALAYHIAAGGGAVAQQFAVGGLAVAREANSEAARLAVEQGSLFWTLEWVRNHLFTFLSIVILVSFSPMLLLFFVYSRDPTNSPGAGIPQSPESGSRHEKT